MSKSVSICLVALSFLTFWACSREKEDAAFLQHVDSLADVLPEQADTLLSSSQDSSHYARLLRVKVDDKLYRPVTGYEPLVIDTLFPYFQRHGDSHRLSTALFYAGRICADKGDAPQAIDYYQQTLDALPDGGSLRFQGLIHIQIGWLFFNQNLLEAAISTFKNAYRYEVAVQDTIYMAHILQSIGSSYLKIDQEDSAFYYYQKALSVTANSSFRQSRNEILEQLAHLFIVKKDYQKARDYLLPVLEDVDLNKSNTTCSLALMLYYGENNIDSALYFCDQLLQTGSVYNKYMAYKALASIKLKQKNPLQALQYQNLWEVYDDSIQRLQNKEVLARMHSLYNYQLREKETQRAKESNYQLKKHLLSLSLVLFVLFSLLIFIYQKKRIQEMELRAKIQELLRKINEADHNEKQMNRESEFRASDIYKKVLAKASFIDSYPMSPEDWTQLELSLDKAYNHFPFRLKKLYQMSDVEIHVSLLLKTGLRPKEIAALCCVSISAVSNIRKRLVEKVTHKSGKAEIWDMIIQEL